MALKRLQYLISGIFRPLDILGHEISLDNENANIQRYLTILADCRTLLLNLSSQVNDMPGIPKDDVVTMGNWSSSAVFENHYCREHLSQFDFSNTLIDIDDASDEDDDQFFDAEDNMTCD
ncbi:unnamed protein product [Rhizopus microsporus]